MIKSKGQRVEFLLPSKVTTTARTIDRVLDLNASERLMLLTLAAELYSNGAASVEVPCNDLNRVHGDLIEVNCWYRSFLKHVRPEVKQRLKNDHKEALRMFSHLCYAAGLVADKVEARRFIENNEQAILRADDMIDRILAQRA